MMSDERDPFRQPEDAKAGGDEKSAGRFVMLPGRATFDKRFHRYPTSLLILCAYASYTSARRDGRCWPSQMLLAKKLGISQQAVSAHARRLRSWGYLERLTHATKGHGTATWRIRYDPTRTLEDVDANTPAKDRHEDVERDEAAETLKHLASEMATVPPVAPAPGRSRNVSCETPRNNPKPRQAPSVAAEPSNNAQVVQRGTSKQDTNSNTSYSSLNNGELVQSEHCDNGEVVDIGRGKSGVDDKMGRALCSLYSRLRAEVYGIAWPHDMHQIELARDLLDLGVTLDMFEAKARDTLLWHRGKNRAPPQSLAWFAKHFIHKLEGRDTVPIARKLANALRA
mgnify:FL=1